MGCGASKPAPSLEHKGSSSQTAGSADREPRPTLVHSPSKEETVEAVAVVVFQLNDADEDGRITKDEAREAVSSLKTEAKARCKNSRQVG